MESETPPINMAATFELGVRVKKSKYLGQGIMTAPLSMFARPLESEEGMNLNLIYY